MKTEDDIINELAAHVARQAAENYLDGLSAYTKSESPIEKVLLAAFIAHPIENVCIDSELYPWPPNYLLEFHWSGTTDYVGQLSQQVQLGNYRVDFYLEAFSIDNWNAPPAKITGKWLQLVIECDGHDFHERTKEQARSDKRRDRWFQTRGISVLRFAGSEIWADPIGCVDQVHDAFFAAWRRHMGRE